MPETATQSAQQTTTTATAAAARILVCTGPAVNAAASLDALLPLLDQLSLRAAPERGPASIVLAQHTPTSEPVEKVSHPSVQTVAFNAASDATVAWLHTAADYRVAADLMDEHSCDCCLLLGTDSEQLDEAMLVSMASAVLLGEADLAVPCYETDLDEALITNALLYPLTRSLFCADVRMPLALDLALSPRMAERAGKTAAKTPGNLQPATILWPVAEAVNANLAVAEIGAGKRPPIDLGETDLKTILALLAGSFFSEIETRAQYWQRNRPPVFVQHLGNVRPFSPESEIDKADVPQMVEDFRLAYASLHEIWSLVLPPNSLLGLKKLSLMPPEEFHLSHALWVRVVYDFVLAHRLRTLNRGHLLGALTPLYLAWVATYLRECTTLADARKHLEDVAQAFEADKPYLVSRWRWPDRFNP